MAEPPSLIGQTISYFCILEKLGGGGMDVAFKAEDMRLRRLVALSTSTAIITVKMRKSDT
jgi:hypothetical protein